MNNMPRLGALAFCLVIAITYTQNAILAGDALPEFKAKHVILLVIDGERFSETWGDPAHENIPRRAKELAPQGALFTRCFNDGGTYTVPGHCALLNGHHEELQGNGAESPAHPTLFQLLLAGGAPVNQAWFVASKEKLAPLMDCSDPAWKGRFQARSDFGNGKIGSGNREDSATMLRARQALSEHALRFMALNLKDPDISGHHRDWNGYLNSIQNSDALAADFWVWIQSQPVLADKTALIITNDHGRHIEGRVEGFASHGDGCSGCRHIGLLALGPDFKRNVVLEERHDQRDIAATLALLLHVNLQKSEGKPIRELFESGVIPVPQTQPK